jgi:Leucine-rich repeat (LRR) protein
MRNLLFILLTASIMLSSCSKEDLSNETENSLENASENGLKSEQIQLKAYPTENNEIFIRDIAADSISIDWGDGTIDEIVPNKNIHTYYSHKYTDGDVRKIVVTGINLTSFNSTVNICELSFGYCPKLLYLFCYDNQLMTLDVSKCPKLEILNCDNNQLTTLSLGKCTELRRLYCGNNRLNILDVSKCMDLTELYCDNNQLTTLDVSKCMYLRNLRCSTNQLTALGVNKCTYLTALYCDNNRLTSLDVSKCAELRVLFCSSNQLSTSALNNLFNGLPMRPVNNYGIINYFNNSGTNDCNNNIYMGKNWVSQ